MEPLDRPLPQLQERSAALLAGGEVGQQRDEQGGVLAGALPQVVHGPRARVERQQPRQHRGLLRQIDQRHERRARDGRRVGDEPQQRRQERLCPVGQGGDALGRAGQALHQLGGLAPKLAREAK